MQVAEGERPKPSCDSRPGVAGDRSWRRWPTSSSRSGKRRGDSDPTFLIEAVEPAPLQAQELFDPPTGLLHLPVERFRLARLRPGDPGLFEAANRTSAASGALVCPRRRPASCSTSAQPDLDGPRRLAAEACRSRARSIGSARSRSGFLFWHQRRIA